MPDKRRRQRRAESTAVVKPAEGAARCSKLTTYVVVVTSSHAYSLTYSLTCGHRRGHSPTSTSHGHRFDSELNRLAAAETGCKGAEDCRNATVLDVTVQARLLLFPTRAQLTHARKQ